MSKLKTTELEQWGPIDTRPLYQSFWYTASARYSDWPKMLAILNHDRVTFYWRGEEMQRGGEKALREILNSDKREKLWRRYVELVRLMQRTSRNGLVSAKKWYKYLSLFWSITLIVEAANFAAPEYLRKKIKKIVPEKDLDKVLEILLAPEKLSFHQQSELELLRTTNFEKYARNWYWLENSYFKSKILTANYFKAQVEPLSRITKKKKIKKILDYVKEVKQKKALVIKKYHLPNEIIKQASAMVFSIWWQDHRKGIIWWSNSITDKINQELSRRFNMSKDDLMYYMAEEWVKLSENDVVVSNKIINQRKEYVIFEFLKNSYRLSYGKQAKKIVNKWLPKKRKQSHNESLQGTVVSTGKAKRVRGRVSILSSPRFIKKMKPGDILVAPMTSPDYIQAMRMAKAIITDVGGLMSHAAVVSRELHIPCIVGTRVATKILKDGDLVEVDADKGVVHLRRKTSVDK